MKKHAGILLTLTFCLSLSACGGKADLPAEETTLPGEEVAGTFLTTAPLGDAVEAAKAYLAENPNSRNSIVAYLEFEGYSSEEAQSAADHCGADWMEQAVKSAQNYLSVNSYSYARLKGLLHFEQFTPEEAAYGLEHCGADWKEQAVKKAESILEDSSLSRQELIDALLEEEFTQEEAEFAAEAMGL